MLHRRGPFIVVLALLLIAAAPGSAQAIPTQTLADPVGDNCRDFTTPAGNWCGPDITQAVFSTPGDGNLHVDITYASLPTNVINGFPLMEAVERVELGIYPKSATTPALVVGTHRFSSGGGSWKLQRVSPAFVPVGVGTAVPRLLGIELLVPLDVLGDAAGYRYFLNAGTIGEVIPEHAELAPNTGLFDLAGDSTGPGPAVTPAISGLAGIKRNQSGKAVSGSVTVNTAGTVTIEALVPKATLRASASAAQKLKRIVKLTKQATAAGEVRFRARLPSAIRRRLAGRRVKVTLRVTFAAPGQSAVKATRKVKLDVPG